MALTRVRAENILDSDFKNSCRATSFTNITLSGGAANNSVPSGVAGGNGGTGMIRIWEYT